MSSFVPLPPNATQAERSLADAAGHFNNVPVVVREVWNADTCPADLLPWLARAVSVDVWDPNWTAEQKRAAIKVSLAVHRKKGTIGAVVDALGALGFRAKVQEWFNQIPQAAPYTYRLILEADQTGYSLDDVSLLLEVVANAKNLRSHLTEIKPIVLSSAIAVMASAVGLGTEITLRFSDAQNAGIIPGFLAAEAQLNTITNTDLPQSIGA